MPKILASDYFPKKTTINPQSVAAAASVTSTYVAVNDCFAIYALFMMGALGGGTVTCSFMQATSAAGAGAKALTATGSYGAFTAVANAVDITQTEIEAATDAMDLANGFYFLAIKVTVAGGSGSLLSAVLHSIDPDFKS